jgi:hypothetical protein
MSDLIDLHVHSTASDGLLTPAQLVERAAALGLRALALTDHDTVGGLKELHAAGAAVRARGGRLETVGGVEVSAQCTHGTMHLVGLFVEPDNEALRAFLKPLAEGRRERNPKIMERLRAAGLDITMEEVEAEAGLNADAGAGGGAVDKSVGRPHIAAVMLRKGFVADRQEAFDKWLAKGKPAYVPRFQATPDESIACIRAAGGLAILAHPPYLQARSEAELEQIVAGLKAAGLNGVETYYAGYSPEQTSLCLRLAKKFDLAHCGGSDFHAPPAKNGASNAPELGRGYGNLAVPYSVLERLRVLHDRLSSKT